MNNLKRLFTVGTIAFTIGATSLTAFATTSYKTPAEVVANLTGRTVESVTEQKNNSNISYGAIANEEGKLEDFQKEILEMKKAILAQKVTDGIITQEQADEIIKALEENQNYCDGTGNAKIFENSGMGFGIGRAFGKGSGNGQGRGKGYCNGKYGN